MPARSNQVRIIAGRWRGRKLAFPTAQNLRPTPDRIRETLFNWLAPWLTGSHCLDLFAGSGALGFEAVSRGAARVVMVERDRVIVQALRDNRQRLAGGEIEIVHQDGAGYLCGLPQPFDVVFLDPPFSETDTLHRAMQVLTESGWLKAGAHIYLERPAKAQQPSLPAGWELLRDKQAGQVRFQLYRYTAE